jgi:uncharacterized LabA/DUF88 family protein
LRQRNICGNRIEKLEKKEMTNENQLAIFIDFENLALWAEREFFDFAISPLIEYLQTRGPLVIKRAYGDWSRFSRYRDELMNNSIDLIQIYSVRGSKNRADIRLSIDAFEVCLTRPQINTYVIVSGDSDFGPLVVKLREYGRYIIGIGPRNITHHLLVKSCDEFVYLETALGETAETDDLCVERENARNLLSKALQAHGQRGELPILATKLRQTMLLMDPAFNEANFGYPNYKDWLNENHDLVNIFIKDLQLYVASPDYIPGSEQEILKLDISKQPIDLLVTHRQDLESQYRQVVARMKLGSIDLPTRRDILRDIYREVSENPGQFTPEEIIDILHERYEKLGLMRSLANINEILQIAIRQKAFDFKDQSISIASPVWISTGIQTEADFICWAEAEMVYAIIRSGLEVDPYEMAHVLLNDHDQVDYINCMLDNLKQRNWIAKKGKRYMLPGTGVSPIEGETNLQAVIQDIEQIQIPSNLAITAETANNLARKAMLQRSQDFVASGNNYLLACRIQLEAVNQGVSGATMEDLRWFMASYASVIAGKLSQVSHDYSAARPYYLAFFALVQEEDPLWSRMRGLINPMLSYFWANAGRELDINISAWNLSMSSPAQIAMIAANHPDPDLRKLWTRITVELAQVNPGILRRIANQLNLNRSDGPESQKTAEAIEQILVEYAPLE